MSECVKESVLQAFFDAELSHDKVEIVSSHLSSCAACGDLARSVEAENSVLNAAFNAEFSLAVPSEALRSRIDDAIFATRAEAFQLNNRQGFFSRLAGMATGLFPAHRLFAAALAAFAVCIIAGVAYKFVKVPVDPRTSASLDMPGKVGPDPAILIEEGVGLTEQPQAVQVVPLRKGAGRVRSRRNSAKLHDELASKPSVNQPLPGEAGYLKAIATLTGAIEASGEGTLKPSVQADYLRSMAVVDRAIDATRKTARQYPRDKDAVAFLYSSYQSKVDLLNAVADQSLLASR